MRVEAISCAVAAPPAASQHHPAAVAATAITTACRPPPRNEEGPAAWGADRAWGTAETNHVTPVLRAGAASVLQVGADAVPGFPFTKAEATLAARLALLGYELNRVEVAGDGASYVAARWDRGAEALADLADLAAVAEFADRLSCRDD